MQRDERLTGELTAHEISRTTPAEIKTNQESPASLRYLNTEVNISYSADEITLSAEARDMVFVLLSQ